MKEHEGNIEDSRRGHDASPQGIDQQTGKDAGDAEQQVQAGENAPIYTVKTPGQDGQETGESEGRTRRRKRRSGNPIDGGGNNRRNSRRRLSRRPLVTVKHRQREIVRDCLSAGMSPHGAYRKIMEEFDVTQVYAKSLVRGVMADFTDSEKLAGASIVYRTSWIADHLQDLLSRAESMGDVKFSFEVIKELAKVLGVPEQAGKGSGLTINQAFGVQSSRLPFDKAPKKEVIAALKLHGLPLPKGVSEGGDGGDEESEEITEQEARMLEQQTIDITSKPVMDNKPDDQTQDSQPNTPEPKPPKPPKAKQRDTFRQVP